MSFARRGNQRLIRWAEGILLVLQGKCLADAIVLPVLKELIPEGIEYGTPILVEFEPDSLWYETSLTIAAQALRAGMKIEYHTFQHPPDQVKRALTRLGLDVKGFEDDGRLEVVDSYTVQIGLTLPEKSYTVSRSLKVSDWSIGISQKIKAGVPEAEKRWLHIDDNSTVLNRYNSEDALIDFWRIRNIPDDRATESATLHSLLRGVASESFTRQFEALHDGIIDFKSEEKAGEVQHSLRVRIMREKRFSSRWRRLAIVDNGEVTLAD